jgi:hypothetical protein
MRQRVIPRLAEPQFLGEYYLPSFRTTHRVKNRATDALNSPARRRGNMRGGFGAGGLLGQPIHLLSQQVYQLTKPVARLGLKGAQPVELLGGTISSAGHLLLGPAPQFGDLGFSLPPLLLQLTLTFRRRCMGLLNELPCLGRRS